MKRAIIIGASTGIGRAVAIELSNKGYELGLASRNLTELKSLKKELNTKSWVKQLDVTKSNSEKILLDLIKEMKSVDMIYVNSGVGYVNFDFDLEKEFKTIEVNVSGFTRMINVAYKYFENQSAGHIVATSSIAGIRGGHGAPAYGASKAYVSNYLEALMVKSFKEKTNISVTEIIPGFVGTKLIAGDGLFWIASREKAARQIVNAIIKKKKRAYITKRWGLIACLMRNVPYFLYKRF